MSSTRDIKRRIKSVKATKKITKAMELVAASKMKRATGAAFASRPYSEYSQEILDSLSNLNSEAKHPLFEAREVNRILIILVTSNRGLCGGYNSQVIKTVLNFIKNNQNRKIDFVTIGKKGEAALRRLGANIIATFPDFPDAITFRDIAPVTQMIMDMYKKSVVDQVLIAYTHFLSGMVQTPALSQVLPIDINKILRRLPAKDEKKTEFIIEPGYNEIIPSMAEKLSRMQIYQMLLESNASEQSARMLAMKNASEASEEMIEDLTLVFNKARQSNITREISEISAGMASVS